MSKFVSIYQQVMEKKRKTLREEIVATEVEKLPRVVREAMEDDLRVKLVVEEFRNRDSAAAKVRLLRLQQQLSQRDKQLDKQ